MLVYANSLVAAGDDAEAAILKAIGGWLKEQLGFGLHPERLTRDGDYSGRRGEKRSTLRIHGCYDGDPALCAWVLKHGDDDIWARQWTVEVGLKRSPVTLQVTCVVKTTEHNTLVSSPVNASQPRVIQYIIRNVRSPTNVAEFVDAVPGEIMKTVGPDQRTYEAFRAEVERRGRDGAIVVVSATDEGEYLLNPAALQPKLVGLADVVQVDPKSNSYEMADVLGKPWSAWGGAVNVLSIPSASGTVRYRYFLSDEIRTWGDEQQRISKVLAWVTASTNIARLRMHVRPEGVALLSMRRSTERARAASERMNIAELKENLDEALKRANGYDRHLDEIVDENARLQEDLSRYQDELIDAQNDLQHKDHKLNALKGQLSGVKARTVDATTATRTLQLVIQKNGPSPLDCLDLIEQAYGDSCTILTSARNSAERMGGFIGGRKLLGLLVDLVTTYREGLMDGSDVEARRVFGKNEFAAKESDKVMKNKAMRRERTFDYKGAQVEMLRHLKIGVSDDLTQTIRVHFHWDADCQTIVIGHCGEHLPVSIH